MDVQFVKVSFDSLNNKEYLRRYKSKHMCYLLMKKNIVRNPYPGDLGLWSSYWKKGQMASSRPIRWFADKFGMKKTNTILRWIKELEQEGAIKIDKIPVGGGLQNVYILGEHNSGIGKLFRDTYYIDGVSPLAKPEDFAQKVSEALKK